MDTQQARDIVSAHANKDTALRNLVNATAMADDDARSTEMVEAAGDQYAEATAALIDLDLAVAQQVEEAKVETAPEGSSPAE